MRCLSAWRAPPACRRATSTACAWRRRKFGYKSLGAGSANVTKAQHCRAEVYLSGFGWVPVDPADVRKVVLEEPPGNLRARPTPRWWTRARRCSASWEMNWLAYNVAHDIALPGAKGPQLEFLMYPQAETAAGRLDCLDPDTFSLHDHLERSRRA